MSPMWNFQFPRSHPSLIIPVAHKTSETFSPVLSSIRRHGKYGAVRTALLPESQPGARHRQRGSRRQMDPSYAQSYYSLFHWQVKMVPDGLPEGTILADSTLLLRMRHGAAWHWINPRQSAQRWPSFNFLGLERIWKRVQHNPKTSSPDCRLATLHFINSICL